MTIQPTGKLADVYVVHSSGYNMLDKAALRSVRQIRHLPDVQKKWLAGHPFDMVIPVEYRLVSR
jgi:TonB family protein